MSSSMEMQRRPRSSTDHSSNLIPTSMSSDTSLSANQQPESPPGIFHNSSFLFIVDLVFVHFILLMEYFKYLVFYFKSVLLVNI